LILFDVVVVVGRLHVDKAVCMYIYYYYNYEKYDMTLLTMNKQPTTAPAVEGEFRIRCWLTFMCMLSSSASNNSQSLSIHNFSCYVVAGDANMHRISRVQSRILFFFPCRRGEREIGVEPHLFPRHDGTGKRTSSQL
jgi:hypothetical protein